VNHPTLFIIAALFCSTAAAGPEQVTCDSPCDCHGAHGAGGVLLPGNHDHSERWTVKTDASLPPTEASAIQAVTPSDMFSWPGPDAPITMRSERTGIENKWFALTGRVVELKVEEDGDLHIALHDVTGDKPGVVVCEIPAQPQWCEIRTADQICGLIDEFGGSSLNHFRSPDSFFRFAIAASLP
jgi:hypothetical protein